MNAAFNVDVPLKIFINVNLTGAVMYKIYIFLVHKVFFSR